MNFIFIVERETNCRIGFPLQSFMYYTELSGYSSHKLEDQSVLQWDLTSGPTSICHSHISINIFRKAINKWFSFKLKNNLN